MKPEEYEEQYAAQAARAEFDRNNALIEEEADSHRRAAGAPQPPATPELDRRSAILDEANRLGEFIDFLDEQGITLCKWGGQSRQYESIGDSDAVREQLLANFFGLDLDKVEAERRAILAHLRGAA